MTDGGDFCDFYALLGVAPDADTARIDAAYRAQVRMWHPDTNPDPTAGARMVALNEARAVLSDPRRRAGFDHRRKARQLPEPRLSPSSVDFGVIHPGRPGPTVTIRVLNDGGTPATVRVEPEAGRFWQVVAVRGGTVTGELAQLDLTACASPAPPGPKKTCFASSATTARPRCHSPPWWPSRTGRRRRRRLGPPVVRDHRGRGDRYRRWERRPWSPWPLWHSGQAHPCGPP